MNTKKAEEYEKKIGYTFKDKELLITALTHSSYINELRLNKYNCNERLEFLGDAVLELVSSGYIFRKYPEMTEGDMSKLRASYVCEPTLALCAREYDLGDYLLLGKGEDMNGGRFRDSILSDALEATIGAVYLDGGFEEAKKYIDKVLLNDIENKKLFYDSKTILQEMIQSDESNELSYELIKEEGPDHMKEFHVAAILNGERISVGIGSNKKKAEQEAAYRALLNLKNRNC
ncbi:MAG: ribonuclease III [Lachnospiraceae bacterium]|nr:ribonuclease III [Lachnospiraceae bacterium]